MNLFGEVVQRSRMVMMSIKFRYIPLIHNLKLRTIIGFIIVVLSAVLTAGIFGKGRIEIIVLINLFAWIVAVFLTDKYVHKYPQRYLSYLIASHLKAAIIMAIILWIMGRIAGISAAPHNVLWTGFLFFVFADALVSVPSYQDIPLKISFDEFTGYSTKDTTPNRSSDSGYINKDQSVIDKQAIIEQIRPDLDKPIIDFIEDNLLCLHGASGGVMVVDDIINTTDVQNLPDSLGIIIGRTRINDVHRLNQFMEFCTEHIGMGGYLILRYIPLENVIRKMRIRYSGLFYWMAFISHFIWYRAIPKIPWLDRAYFFPKLSWLDDIHLSLVKKRNRPLSKAEVWGRLSFWGMRVLAESKGEGELYIIAQRITSPITNKIPSYYPIAALEKVGLDGKIIWTHKIRTMFPFSEFLQARIFEDHGLAPTGKFANDFRLTDYGKFLRKYWLDELPQIFDWLRGDIKLVGMRATSRHFLSLYPRTFLNLYVQIKPGLIPPIFNESTNGFEEIVEVEFTYLQRYWDHPFLTDIRCLIQTFADIVFKGVRSR